MTLIYSYHSKSADHEHEWQPDEDGMYICAWCPATKSMSIEDAAKLWDQERDDDASEVK
jgi:hypothetical protein